MEKKTKMVGIVIVSHSNRLAEEVINFSKILQQDKFNIENGGNVDKEVYGTTVDNVKNAIKREDGGNGVLVFVDMGSSIFHSINAIEQLKGEVEAEIADAPLVEGVISAVAGNFRGITLKELKNIAEESRSFTKVKKI